MSTIERAYGVEPGVSVIRVLSNLGWAALFLPLVLFAWHQSHFQYDVYMPGDYGLTIHRVTLAAAVLAFALALSKCYPQSLAHPLGGYVLIALLYGALEELLNRGGKLPILAQAIAFAVIMLPIISSRRLLFIFIGVNFTIGILLIALNTVPVLHWLNIVQLPHEQVIRFASEKGNFHLDPLHFGLFGLTESSVTSRHPLQVARLQGFSFEPIHWAYFVYLTAACGLFLMAPRSKLRIGFGEVLVITLIAAHLTFVFSTAAFLAALAWVMVLCFMWVLRRRRIRSKREAAYGVVLLLLVPGLLIPFMLALVPALDAIPLADEILSEGANWESKIGFLSLGLSLYTRFFPMSGEIPAAGHNLILSTYLKFGYLLLLPLLFYLGLLIKRGFADMPFPVLAGTSLTLLAHTMLVPQEIFYPSGAMWLAIPIGVAYHAHRWKRPLGTRAALPNGDS